MDGLGFLREYGVRVNRTVAAPPQTGDDERISICASRNPAGTEIEVRCGGRSEHRTLPLDAFAAASLLLPLVSESTRAVSRSSLRAFSRLLVDLSRSFAHGTLDRCAIDARLNARGFTITSASVSPPPALDPNLRR